ncbi:M42 family metallopeptidase [Rubritalea marina]|uniref:M42 family metallopeptidase n=1 Tax=Rubritalea marina TaxID=361055 RepID=UPI00036B9D89|nr:M42 family metallopeptidase [Rubritalea marina]
MKKKAQSLLQELTEAHAVSGYEEEVREIFVNELTGIGELSADKMGGVYCETGSDGPSIMLAGHMDEVGFRVKHITPGGFLKIVAVGGWWTHTLLSQRVEVKTQSGNKVLGVISSVSPHHLSPAERSKVLDIAHLFIDIGASSQADTIQNFGISLGDPIAPAVPFSALGKPDHYLAKAFDNRVGMACVIQSLQELAQTALPNQLTGVGTVQEEVGLRGASVAARKVQPDVAIILEGPPADDSPGFNPAESQGALGAGVQIRIQDPTALMNPRLVALVERVAQENQIPYQITVRDSGGTDAGNIHKENLGIPSVVLGTPARYIHSHNAMINLNDYLAMVQLSTALVKALDQETVDGLTKYL